MPEQINREQWILLALKFAGSQGLSPVQLQKSLFLLGKELPNLIENFYNFIPFNYGPFCSDIYGDIKQFAAAGKVVPLSRPGVGYPEYALSDEGRREAESIAKRVDPATVNYLGRVVEWAQSLGFAELVRSIYERYPEYRANSVFRG